MPTRAPETSNLSRSKPKRMRLGLSVLCLLLLGGGATQASVEAGPGTAIVPLHGLRSPVLLGGEGDLIDPAGLLAGCGLREGGGDAKAAPPAALLDRLEWQARPPAPWRSTPTGSVQQLEATYLGAPVLEMGVNIHRDRSGALQWLVMPRALWDAPPPPDVGLRGPWAADATHLRALIRILAGDRHAETFQAENARRWLWREGELIPVYQLLQDDGQHDRVSAWIFSGQDGELIERQDLALRLDWPTGEGYVFDPNPVVVSGNTDLLAGDDVDPYRERVPLRLLDGTGYLRGTWADVHSLAGRAYSQTLSYLYSADDLHFEEVMAYYHITEAQRWLRALGFEPALSDPQQVVVHATGFDASWFSLVTGKIHLGDGGVNDGEDADVILHEFGHAIFHSHVHSLGGGDIHLLSEGWADYFAASRTGGACVGDWDAAGRLSGCIRDISEPRRYPIDLIGDAHADGRILSSLLWRVRSEAGAEAVDRLATQALLFLTPGSTLPDMARALATSAHVLDAESGSDLLTHWMEDALAAWGFQPRQVEIALEPGALVTSPGIPVDFTFAPPGVINGGLSDSIRVRGDGAVLLTPAIAAPLVALQTGSGQFVPDALQADCRGTLWSLEIELRFLREERVIRHASLLLAADGGVELTWFGEGDRETFPSLAGWFPQGSSSSAFWLDLTETEEASFAAGEGFQIVTEADGEFPLVGAALRLEPGPDSSYRALRTSTPAPSSAQSDLILLVYPSPARPHSQILLDIPSAGAYRLDLFSPEGRVLSTVDLGHLPPGRYPLHLSALALGQAPPPTGATYLRLSGAGRRRVSRLLLLK